MSAWRSKGAAALLAVVAACDSSPPPRTAVLAPTIVTVARGVHLLGETLPNAAYAVETGAGIVLVDTCKEPDAEPIVQQFLALGLDVSKLRAILLTHVHADHALGAEALRAMTGAKVYAGRGDCDALRAGAPREAFYSTYSVYDPAEQPHPTTVDVELAGGEEIAFGGDVFRAMACPGHTPGCVSYLMERDGERLLFTGDVVSSLTDEAPGTGLGIYQAYNSSRYRGNAKDYLATIRALLAMPAPDLVLPGHPRNDPEPQSPRLPKARWTAMLERAAAKMEALIERNARDGEDHLDGIAKTLEPGLHYLGNYSGAALYAVTTKDGRVVLIDAPGGAALPAIVGAALRDAKAAAAAPSAVLVTSAEPAVTAGLPSLLAASPCVVFAPRAAIEEIRAKLPAGADVRAAEDLAAAGWLDAETLAVAGRGTAPAIAYVLRVAGKTVLAGGRYPVRPIVETELGLAASVTDAAAYAASMDTLAKIAPDLWLPLVPVHDQNANVYGDEWKETLARNRAAARGK